MNWPRVWPNPTHGAACARRTLLCLATVVQFAAHTHASDFRLGPLIQVSKDPDVLAGCDTGFRPPGNMNFDDQFETRIAVDPTNARHLVATWGETALPGITTCTGGPYIAAVDPYLRSIAPNGHIYLASVAFSGSSAAIVVNKSTDGGLTWTLPITIAQVSGAGKCLDKPSTTAEPSNPLLAYVVF